MTTQAHNPMAALLGIRALRGFYALTDADGYVMTVIDYMPHRARPPTARSTSTAPATRRLGCVTSSRKTRKRRRLRRGFC